MKTIIKWMLAAFIGSSASFLLVIISEGIHQLLTCGIVALLVGATLYYAVLEKSDLKLIGSIAIAITAFILYFILYSHTNENTDSNLLAFIVFFVPYIIFAYILFGLSGNNTDQGEKKT